MTSEVPPSGGAPEKAELKKPATRRKRERRELRVAFDTNVLFTGSASDLVRQEAATLISQSRFPDLDIKWYLPDVVRLERQFQMQKGALELLTPLGRVEKLLGHNLNITQEILVERVEKVIAQRQAELGLIALKPEYAGLDWERLVLDAAFRRAPFQDGKTEKGFRDALVVESFMHLVSLSPRTPKVCRIAFVTGDALLADALRGRLSEATNTVVLDSLEGLRGFLNALVSEVDEAFLASLRPKAEKLFFAVKDDASLLYKEGIRERLREKFAVELALLPAGATGRKNGTWGISAPTFSKKTGQRIQWTSRIEIEAEATKVVYDEARTVYSDNPALQYPGLAVGPAAYSSRTPLNLPQGQNWVVSGAGLTTPIFGPSDATLHSYLSSQPFGRTVVTHKGIDLYEVLWSVDVTTALDLRRPLIDDIAHVEVTWEPVT